MEIIIVLIIVILALILAIFKLHRIITGKESGCSCSGNCPFLYDITKCTGAKNTCDYFDKDKVNAQKKHKTENAKST